MVVSAGASAVPAARATPCAQPPSHALSPPRSISTATRYDGGGLYRHVYFTSVSTPGPYLGIDGTYAPALVTGPITWTGGAPFADASLTPSVEVWSNASAASPFCLALTVLDASGATVGSASGCGSAPGGGAVTVWSPSAPIALPQAALWHTPLAAPLKPALYTLAVALTVAGAAVDAGEARFGVRQTEWRADTGFWLNGVNTKIKGMANHQDAQAVGVGVPDHLQYWRVLKLVEMGANGWRTGACALAALAAAAAAVCGAAHPATHPPPSLHSQRTTRPRSTSSTQRMSLAF